MVPITLIASRRNSICARSNHLMLYVLPKGPQVQRCAQQYNVGWVWDITVAEKLNRQEVRCCVTLGLRLNDSVFSLMKWAMRRFHETGAISRLI